MSGMLQWLWGWWDRNNRHTDMKILWPSCKKEARDIGAAKRAFYIHILSDPAWNRYYTSEELREVIDNLK